MSKKGAIRSMIIIMVALLLLSGCGNSLAKDKNVDGNVDVQGKDSRRITDVFGREVIIPDEVKTIAAVGGAARIITYAGCADLLVGVTEMDKENITAMPYSVVNAEHFANLKSVGSGGSNDTPYMEELIVLNPDVIIGLTDEEALVNIADKTGIPTIGIYPDGMFDESFYKSLQLIGEIAGEEAHVASVIDALKGWEEELNLLTKDISNEKKPSVYTGAVSYRGAHGFEGTYAKYPPFKAIHANNVVDETEEEGAFIVDLEKITIWDPEIVFLNPANMNLVNEDYIKNKAFYESLQAVQNNRIYSQIPYNYNWTNMELAIANAFYAGKVIFPQEFEGVDPIAKADEIFTVLLGQPFYDRLVAEGYEFKNIKLGE
ncbi:ABC transporter substrate-binding protein [Alkalibacter rhizosphaerae]|uniref:ABC transporter substrate-binding protein n=1 Tax=Alkalibacter rhizosphaerae TaxID=2815577 RepID=A0A974XHJ6_9FIRM|nr:ABC transporter substrate-binding protein [Alkalibacter rhizosphaerae]QSX08795.1 ABC transporter substrate-binding protein [Alkalibacter rhizosphaerae]